MLESGCAFLNIAVHMKNLVTILSHCDTLEKIDALKQLTQELKNLKIDTLLISHVPLDPSLQKEVAYYIYDQDNPLLCWPERALSCWDKTVGTGTLPVKLVCLLPDYGWTVMDQIFKATNFALPLKYDYYSFINYDTLLTSELQSYLLDPSLSGCPITVTHSDSWFHTNNEHPSSFSLIFTILEHTVLSQVKANISKSGYMELPVAEAYWYSLLSPYSHFAIPSPAIDTMSISQIDTTGCSRRTDARSQLREGYHFIASNQNHFNDHFQVFFQNGNNPDEPRLTRAYFFHIKDPPIQLKCNNQTHVIKKASVIDLPENVTKLGVWDEAVYCDFLPEFNRAAIQCHSITQFDSAEDLYKA